MSEYTSIFANIPSTGNLYAASSQTTECFPFGLSFIRKWRMRFCLGKMSLANEFGQRLCEPANAEVAVIMEIKSFAGVSIIIM